MTNNSGITDEELEALLKEAGDFDLGGGDAILADESIIQQPAESEPEKQAEGGGEKMMSQAEIDALLASLAAGNDD